MDIKYGHSHFKSAFKINLRLLEVVKLKILKYINVIWLAFFLTKFFPEKAKHPQICQRFGDNLGKTLFRHRPFIPPPIMLICSQ